MAKKKEFKTTEDRAKEIADRTEFKVVDQYNWRMKDWLTGVQVIEAMRTLAHFISIPTQILNETETAMFDETLFEKINVTAK